MKPAARLTDPHVCPASDGPKPHVGGPILGPGSATVMINDLAAAVAGDSTFCVGTPSTIQSGSTTVQVCDKPLARMGDPTSHGGSLTQGSPDVLSA